MSSATDKIKVLIDTDPGIDDILAMLLALHSPNVDIKAITVVNGNTSLENAHTNVLMMFDVIKAQQDLCNHVNGKEMDKLKKELVEIPYKTFSKPFVAKGAAKPIKTPQVNAEHVHGEKGRANLTRDKLHEMLDGFKNLFQSSPKVKKETSATSFSEHELYFTSSRDAAEEILFQLKESEINTLNLIMLGPLTNLALAIQKDPELQMLSRVKNIFIMGGCISHPTPGGNVTETAEFNFYADPVAASMVLGSGLPITLVPLDVTENCRLRYGVFEETIVPLAQKAPLPSFVSSFLEHLFSFMSTLEEADGSRLFASYDSHGRKSPPSSIHEHSKLLDIANEVRLPEDPGRLILNRSPSHLKANVIESDRISKSRITQSSSIAMHDPLCMAICLNRDLIIKSQKLNVKVETEGALTKGMCIVDGRRWKRKQPLNEERQEFVHHLEVKNNFIEVVLQVDNNRFFSNFMTVVFGIKWNEEEHAWSSKFKK